MEVPRRTASFQDVESERVGSAEAFSCILGTSRNADAIRAFGRRAARVDATVLLTGESGTGKGLLAHAIHDASTRAGAPFVAVNCAGIAETLFESEFFGHTRGAFTGAQQQHRGLFEQADRGTLFLDEVGELARALQAKLLTALEDGEIRRVGAERTVRVNFRTIAATGVDLESAVVAKHFRADLYHRLHVLRFCLPALRERADDLPLLCEHYLDYFRRRYNRGIRGFAASALDRIAAHQWPGNIRELAHAVEAATLACEETHIASRHLPEHVGRTIIAEQSADTKTDAKEHAANGRYSFYGPPSQERHRIEAVLRECSGNRTRAAARLGMARNTLRAKLRALCIEERSPAGDV
jgi:two-component system response regulator HydG